MNSTSRSRARPDELSSPAQTITRVLDLQGIPQARISDRARCRTADAARQPHPVRDGAGIDAHHAVLQRLGHAEATSISRPVEVATRPNSVALPFRPPALPYRKRNSGATSQKVSSRATRIAVVTPAGTVGSKKVPPAIMAPAAGEDARALRGGIGGWASTFSSPAVSISGPLHDARLAARPTSASPRALRASAARPPANAGLRRSGWRRRRSGRCCGTGDSAPSTAASTSASSGDERVPPSSKASS